MIIVNAAAHGVAGKPAGAAEHLSFADGDTL
jgi:hypothetical protein